jgi:aminocarboxymuconate-semialdehyde decarboxylase
VTFDVHAHVIVPEITGDEAWQPQVWRDDSGSQVVELGGKQIRAAVQEFTDIDAILAAQDAAGVDRVLLCPWVPLLYYDAEPDEGLARARIQNEALARLAHDHPDRIAALGALPLQDPELAAGELRELMDEGTLRGVEVAASVRGVFLGDDRFEPFWQAAEDTGSLVFVHPTTRGFDAPAFQDYYLWNTVANPLETATTAAHMVVAGVMERHPGLRVLLAHAGASTSTR